MKRAAAVRATQPAPSAPTVQPLTEEQIDELAGLHCLYPRRFAKSVMHACAAAWGVTMAGITAAQPPAAMPVPGGMTDAEIDAVTCAQWGEQLGSMVQAHRAYARAILAAQSVPATGAQPWQPIETAPKVGKRMFVVIGIDVQPTPTSRAGYTSDPRCVWRDDDGNFARWHHAFPPTHWHELPDAIATAPTGSAG